MLRRAWICGTLALVACASPRPAPSSTPPPSSTQTSRDRVAAEEPPVDPGPCAAVTATEHLTLDQGAWRTSATGLSIRYEGASHDSFEGGGTDLSLALALRVEGEPSERWLPSASPPQYAVFLGHCEVLSRTIEQIPGHREWRAEHVARVVDVCPAPEAG